MEAQAAGPRLLGEPERHTLLVSVCALLSVNVAGTVQTSVKGMGEGHARDRCVSEDCPEHSGFSHMNYGNSVSIFSCLLM